MIANQNLFLTDGTKCDDRLQGWIDLDRKRNHCFRQGYLGIEEHISGVILFEETCGQKTEDGRNFVELLRSRGIHAGIKLDKGLVELMGTDKETATTGLDGLADRCKKFYA